MGAFQVVRKFGLAGSVYTCLYKVALALIVFYTMVACDQVALESDEGVPELRSDAGVAEEHVQSFQASVASGEPYLQALYDKLYDINKGRYAGVSYALSHDNQLTANWVAQTPRIWGKSASSIKGSEGSFIADDVYELVSSAKEFVDITTLRPYPDGEYKARLLDGLKVLAESGRPIKVRILAGWDTGTDPTGKSFTQSEYLEQLIESLKKIDQGNLEIYVAAQRRNPTSWNHAKMIAVDARRGMVGGQNLWEADYLKSEPVHDLNVILHGSSAYHMHLFADVIWRSVCAYPQKRWKPAYWKSGMEEVSEGCLDKSYAMGPVGEGDISVLGAGRYAGLVNDNNPADDAMLLALKASDERIRLAIQDLRAWGSYWKPGVDAIADALVNERDVFIVLTNDKSKSGSGRLYSLSSIESTAKTIFKRVRAHKDAPKKKKAVRDLLCKRLFLTSLRFGADTKWPNGYTFANHAKFFMVDDKVFYVGSENLYPANLIEYGVFISDPRAVEQIKDQYWNKIWSYSSIAAISGTAGGVGDDCVFRRKWWW